MASLMGFSAFGQTRLIFRPCQLQQVNLSQRCKVRAQPFREQEMMEIFRQFYKHEQIPPMLTSTIGAADVSCYDAERAVEAHQKMAKLDPGKLVTPGKVEVPYTGIGMPPVRPGGDLVVVGREHLAALIAHFEELRSLGTHGNRTYVSGPIGSGKSVMLRQLSVYLYNVRQPLERIVCIWNNQTALDDFVAQMQAALSFTYATDVEVLDDIARLQTGKDVEGFLASRIAKKEEFFFILDGGEIFDEAHDELDIQRSRVLENVNRVIRKAKVSIIGLSPMADKQRRNRKAESRWFYITDGFSTEETVTYMMQLSLLSRACAFDPLHRLDDLKLYAGRHPLSLSVLNSCCWQLARERYRRNECFPFRSTLALTEDKVLQQLQEPEDWDEVLKLFISSEQLEHVRLLAREALSKAELKEVCHNRRNMMKLDKRFVYGDPDKQTSTPFYVTGFIERIYVEEMRTVEKETVKKGGAWEPYCRHLLDNSVRVNWTSMGWICEDFLGDVIATKGLIVNKLKIPSGRLERFGVVPDYSTWIDEVKAGGVVVFLPLKYTYGSVDGVVVAMVGGKLVFMAIQMTVNDGNHQESALKFMRCETIDKWIPEKHRSDWKLHYAFICLRDLPATNVAKTDMRCEYLLHTISFTSAFSSSVSKSVLRTLEDMVSMRDQEKRTPMKPPVHARAASTSSNKTKRKAKEATGDAAGDAAAT